MTDDLPDRAGRALAAHDAFERVGDDAFAVTTIPFENRVTAAETDDWALAYTVTVRAPTIESATDDAVGPAVVDGWFETYERRLADAHKATRASVEFASFSVREDDGDAVATFTFEFGNADRAPDVAKAIAEYVEGTYVEGIVPGYDYVGTVADLLGDARRSAGDDGGPMPL